MSDGPDSLVSRHLVRTDEKLDRVVVNDQTEVKQRLGTLEEGVASVSRRLDGIDEPVARIGRRLDLIETH